MKCKEIAKIACGLEAFHANPHARLWSSGDTLPMFGTATTPSINVVSVIVNPAIGLGIYGWRSSAGRKCEHRTLVQILAITRSQVAARVVGFLADSSSPLK